MAEGDYVTVGDGIFVEWARRSTHCRSSTTWASSSPTDPPRPSRWL